MAEIGIKIPNLGQYTSVEGTIENREVVDLISYTIMSVFEKVNVCLM
jgi:hypothetical protein